LYGQIGITCVMLQCCVWNLYGQTTTSAATEHVQFRSAISISWYYW